MNSENRYLQLARLLLRHPLAKIALLLYFLLLVFWFWIFSVGSIEGLINNVFGLLYPLISLSGGLFGLLFAAKKWGGFKSVMGKGIIFLSLGLLAEVFGQWAWSYFTIIQQVEVPYPSIADLGYFAIVPFYAYAMYNFSIAAGIKFSLKTYLGKIQAIIVPLVMISVAYFLFLEDVSVDLENPLKTFLDFGYPGFEAIAISIGILTYSLSRNLLGGIMQPRILYFVFALIAQYVTDYYFLYSVGVETYYNGGIVDLMYATSLTIMTLGIVSFAYLDFGASKQGKATELNRPL